MKKALITGITGQDGSYLAELLLDKGYEVHGIVRRASTFNTSRLDHLYKDPLVDDTKLYLHYGDLADAVQLVKLLYDLQPDEIYNLEHKAMFVFHSIFLNTQEMLPVQLGFWKPFGSGLVTKVRYYQASSSEMFGKVQEVPQVETTLFGLGPHIMCRIRIANCKLQGI